MERRVEELERVLRERNAEPSSSIIDSVSPAQRSDRTTRSSQAASSELRPDSTRDITLNLSCSLGAFPASSLQDSALDQSGSDPDLISRGFISELAAGNLFTFFQKHLNPYIHYILSDNITLGDIRARSSLLTAAICAVAALCSGSPEYQNCLEEYQREVTGKLFLHSYTFDDVRAVCIGAMWLSDMSSSLGAIAVRMSGKLNLHRCITKMPHTKRACYERTRLYFIVYIVDHHCSLNHGRPPMTRELSSLKAPRALLQAEFATPKDLCLVSHMELWSISTQVFDVFGADIESSFNQMQATELQRLNNSYDEWYREWTEILTLRNMLDPFTQHLFSLYYSAAKLYLFSHVFRGPGQREIMPPLIAQGTDTGAQRAIEQALAIIRYITDGKGKDIRLLPGNLPVHFSTVTAFASVLLLRASWQTPPSYSLDKDEVFQALQRMVQSIQDSSVGVSHVHALLAIANSLRNTIGGSDQADGDGLMVNFADSAVDPSLLDFDLFGRDLFGLSFVENDMDWTALSGPATGNSTFEVL